MGWWKWLQWKRQSVGIPPSDQRDRSAEAPEDYINQLRIFTGEVAGCMQVSRDHGGIRSPTARHYYASVLFTALITRATSLAFLAPYSFWARRDFEHWDYATVANVTRTILETRLVFFYICIEECTDAEWQCRWNIMNLHDCVARISLMQAMNDKAQVTALQSQGDELRERLKANTFFTSLPDRRQAELLKGNKAYLVPLEETAAKADLDLHVFKLMWKLTSSHVHSLPMSFYRMEGAERGTGVQTKVEEGYTTLLLSFALTLIVGARDEFTSLMEGVAS